MKQRFFQLLAVLFVLAGLILCPGRVFAHEFELGEVERSLDVVVRERRVQISYAIGLGDITMLEWLVREEQLDRQQERRFRRLIDESKSVLDTGVLDTGVLDTEEAASLPSEVSSPASKAAPESDPVPTEAGVEPAKFQQELVALFKEKLSEKICANLRLSYDDQVVEFSEQTLVDTARHHVVLEVRFVAEIPQRKTGVLRLVDRNFLQRFSSEATDQSDGDFKTPAGKAVSGAATLRKAHRRKDAEPLPSEFRYHGRIRRACRVKGGAVLVNSNVAPVLARAKVSNVAEMNHEQRVLSATIEAKLAFVAQ